MAATTLGALVRIAGRDGKANMAWTDMRRVVSLDGETGHTENSFFARK